MKAIDMHCDTVSGLYKDHRAGGNASILKNFMMIDPKKIQAGNYELQNFALYTNLDRAEGKPFEYCIQLLDTFYNEMKIHKDMIGIVKSYKDTEESQKQGKVSALLTIEEGDVCQGELELLHNFYRLSVRMMTLTWNYPSGLIFPNKREMWENSRSRLVADTEDGLTETGVRFVREMERLGMIVDISHLNGAGIWDVFRHTRRPLVASHSNTRAVASHTKNLTDEVIRALAERGGVVGANYYFCFLHDLAEGESGISHISHMVDHMKHIHNIGGIGCLSLRSDFDGIECELGIKDASQLSLLADAMSREDFSQSDMEAVSYKNILGLCREILRS